MVSNLEMLQKISLGTDNIQNVTIELEDESYDFTIRPLTDGELTKLQVIEKRPYSMKMKLNRNGEREPVKREDEFNENNEMDVDMGSFTEVQAESMYTAIAWSLSIDGENIPVKTVKGLPKGVPELLFDKVIEISRLTSNDLSAIKNFRKF